MVHASLFFGTVFLTLAELHAAPTRYDQRQDGDFNLHAQLKNFLFVIAIPSNNDLLSDIVMQAQQVISRSNAFSSLSGDRESNPMSSNVHKSNEETDNAESYSPDVTQLDNSDQESVLPHDAQDPSRAEVSNASNRHLTAAISIGESQQSEKTDNVARTVRSAKNFEQSKNRETLIPGYFVDMKRLYKTQDSGRARNVVGGARNPDVESEKPGTSLKKRLFRKEDTDVVTEEDVAPSSSNTDKNVVATLLPDEKRQELRLLGDSIENCGPGRRRDAVGICQFEESAASLL